MLAPLTSGVRLSVFLPSIPGQVFGHGVSTNFPSSSAAFFGAHALRILARSGANKQSSSQPGSAASLPLAVCPSAARSPPCGAKVLRAIAVWLPVLRQSANHCGTRQRFMRISRPAMIPREEFDSIDSQLWPGQAQFHPVTQREFGVHRSNAKQQGTAHFGSSAGPSRPSLTCRSRGRFQNCSLRQCHAGAPYLWR